jgi:hypothetical protein
VGPASSRSWSCRGVSTRHRKRCCKAPPTDPSEWSFLSLDPRTPYVASFFADEGGKTAHYMLSCVATTGEKRPWSETASPTIGA